MSRFAQLALSIVLTAAAMTCLAQSYPSRPVRVISYGWAGARIADLPRQQIAHAMDKREGAIRALQMRALMSLRRVLERQDEAGAR